jgi:hypothetical protein
MAETKETIIFEIVVDKEAGEMSIAGLTNGTVSLEKGIKLVNKELDNLGKNFKKTKDVSGLAGATLNEVGRTISDMPYGIQGVSNNLAQLTSLFGGMVQGTNSAKEAFKQLIGTLVGNPILAITIVVQALIAAYTVFKKNQQQVTKEVDSVTKAVSNAGSALKISKEALDDENVSLSEKKQIIASINKEYPELNAQLDKNGKLTKESKEAIDGQIESLGRLAKAQAIQKLIELEMEKIAIAQAKSAGDSADNIDILKGAIVGLFGGIQGQTAEIIKNGQKTKDETIKAAEEAKDKYTQMLKDEGLVDLITGQGKQRPESLKKIKQLKTDVQGINKEVLDDMKKYYERVFEGNVFDIKPQIKSMQDNAKEALKGLKKVDTSIRDNQEDLDVFLYNKRQQAKEATIAAMADLGNNIASLLDADFQKQLDVEQNKTNAINNELRNRLLNENLSKEERKKIQNEIALNDEKLRAKQEKIEKKRFEMQKAANISRAVIDTYVAANAALAAGGGVPYGIPAMIATIAAGLAQVATIAKQQFVSSQSGVPLSVGVIGDTGGASGATAPDFNIVGQSTSNQIAAAVKGQFSQPIKAFVVSKEVSSAQEFDRNVVTAASLG